MHPVLEEWFLEFEELARIEQFTRDTEGFINSDKESAAGTNLVGTDKSSTMHPEMEYWVLTMQFGKSLQSPNKEVDAGRNLIKSCLVIDDASRNGTLSGNASFLEFGTIARIERLTWDTTERIISNTEVDAGTKSYRQW